MFDIIVVILWLIAGVLTMVNMTKTDSWSLKFNYIIAWIVLMTQLIGNCFGI